MPEIRFRREKFYADILLAIAGAMDRNNTAFHGLRCVLIDQDHRLPNQYDLFEVKQGTVPIDGLRSGVGGESLATVCFSVDRQWEGKSHP